MRILVVKLASLGDLLTITPALRALRTTFGDAHIGVLTTPGSAPALRGLDSHDEIITFDKFAFDRASDAVRSLPSALRLTSELRAGDWDTLVLLHHLTTAFGIAKYAALSLGCGARRRVGLDNGRGRPGAARTAWPDAAGPQRSGAGRGAAGRASCRPDWSRRQAGTARPGRASPRRAAAPLSVGGGQRRRRRPRRDRGWHPRRGHFRTEQRPRLGPI